MLLLSLLITSKIKLNVVSEPKFDIVCKKHGETTTTAYPCARVDHLQMLKRRIEFGRVCGRENCIWECSPVRLCSRTWRCVYKILLLKLYQNLTQWVYSNCTPSLDLFDVVGVVIGGVILSGGSYSFERCWWCVGCNIDGQASQLTFTHVHGERSTLF